MADDGKKLTIQFGKDLTHIPEVTSLEVEQPKDRLAPDLSDIEFTFCFEVRPLTHLAIYGIFVDESLN